MGPNFKHRALIAISLFKLDAERNLQKTLDATKSMAARLVDRKTLLAARHAIPTIYPYRWFAAAGGLISYGPDFADAYRLVGTYAGSDGRSVPSRAARTPS